MPRQPRSFRTQGIILKRRDFGEADRLLTILTPSYGKLEVIAKGARKPTSSKTGHVELFTKADTFIGKGRDIDILVQSEMIEPYLPIREDLQRGAYANYIVELLDRFTYGEDNATEGLFQLLDNTLYNLSHDDDIRLVTRYYEIRLLEKVGFRPELNECVISREMILPEDQFFSFIEGGVVSPGYAHQASGLARISMVTLKALRYMQRSSYNQIKQLELSEARHNDLERIMLGYIMYILESRLQSVDFIRRIRQQTA